MSDYELNRAFDPTREERRAREARDVPALWALDVHPRDVAARGDAS